MDIFWRGQVEITHDGNKFLELFVVSEARVVDHFFSNRGTAATLVVMSGIDDGVAGQGKQLLLD